MTRAEAERYRKKIECAVQSLPDEDALSVASLYPAWDPDTEYDVGHRVRYGETLYTCLTAHTAQETWTPTAAPSLWAKVLIPDPDVIPDWEQPDSTNPYMTGDKVRYDGKVYESLIDNNVWSPSEHPAGWQEVTE